MKVVACPHCGNQGVITSKIPKDVVVVWPCPSCHGFVVLFRNKVIPINREILEHGTPEQRKSHIAEVVAEFLDANFFSSGASPFSMTPLDQAESGGESDDTASETKPITQAEFERWVKFDLQKLDDPVYFRKHFG